MLRYDLRSIMVDLHSHILFGIDDGPETRDDALEMCRIAARDGTDTMVATPHRRDGVHDDPSVELLRERLASLQEELGTTISLVLGCELRLTHTIVEDVTGGAAPTINGGPWVLVEFPPFNIPAGCENAIYRLTSAGYLLLVAHPERNHEIQERPERFYNLMELGLYGQVDTGSILGKFGKEAEATARKLLKCRMVHAISSDCHSPYRRRPGMSEAHRVVAGIVGDEAARALVDDNPRAAVEGRPMPYVPETISPGRRRASRWWPF